MGHGDHWGAFGLAVEELVARVLPTIIDQGEIRSHVRIYARWPNYPEPFEASVYSMEYPTGANLRIKTLHWIDEQTRSIRLMSAFPMGVGPVANVTIDEIREWEYGIEAVIIGSTEDGAMLAFFDTDYIRYRSTYQVGETYRFALSGLAYSVRSAQGDHYVRDDQEQLRRWYEVVGEEPPRDENRLIPAQTISLEGMAALLPSDGDYPEDCTYSCVVEELRPFSADGNEMYEISATFLSGEPDLKSVLYARRGVITEGFQPRPGDTIKGTLWLNGYCID